MPARRASAADTRRALDRLGALKHDQPRREEFAIELLRDFDDPMVLHQALAALGGAAPPAACEPLRRLLYEFAAAPKRDPGGLLRSAILRHLDEYLQADDLPLVERAVVTVERTPGYPAGAAVLRAAALVALDRLEPDLATAHAAVMLANASDGDRTSPMTGEPATTAARVLAARDQWPALLLFVQASSVLSPAEPLFESLRGLTGAPGRVVARVLDDLGDPRELVLLGACDLVVTHRGGPELLAWLNAFIAEVASLDVYRYLVAAIVASRRHDLFEVIAASLGGEFNRDRLTAARDALPLATHEPFAARLIRTIEERLAPK